MPRGVYDRDVRAPWFVAMLAGCYSPTPPGGAPCDERRVCPREQMCVGGRCQPEGTPPPDGLGDAGDSSADALADAAPMLGPWSAPTIVGVAVGLSKSDPSFTTDRLTLVWARNDDLFMSRRPAIGAAWVTEDLDALNTAGREKAPEISGDGTTIYFAADPDGDYDILTSTLVNGAWTNPVKVAAWSSASTEQDVAISPDELTAFVAISGDLRRSTRANKTDPWPAPVDLGIDWGTSPAAPSIDAAGNVYFHAGSTRDLFVARKTATGYATPVPLTELNTNDRDAAPFVSADARHLVFERASELYESSR